ncbi:18S rRNA (guanine-N(7))-methyltransferase [Larus michahellis]|uniref:18S rRNA (guanine-N(7))-methyltransferase-like n=1 Tax=Larus michahellis TaxID=119627 RepID=UPI003D9B1B75
MKTSLGLGLLPAEAQLLPPRPQQLLPLQLLPVVRPVEGVEVEGRRDGPTAGGGGGPGRRRGWGRRAARGLGCGAHVLGAEEAAIVLAAQGGAAQHPVGLADGGETGGGGGAAGVAVRVVAERLLVVRRLDLRRRRRGRDPQHLVKVAAGPRGSAATRLPAAGRRQGTTETRGPRVGGQEAPQAAKRCRLHRAAPPQRPPAAILDATGSSARRGAVTSGGGMAGSGRRPEHRGPPELFYNEFEARKYTQNSRVVEIQSQMSERAVELLGLPEDRPCLLLDVGCGSGLSGDYISDEGHYWIGMDISPAMLDVAVEREVEGDLLLADVGHGIPFRPGMFDGCISISAVQWLCNADKKSHSPPKRLYRFFSTLYTALARGSRAVLQLYPENSEQLELITAQAMRAGFTGGMVVDYPNSAKAKKFFLCLFVGASGTLPKGLGTECADGEEIHQAKFTNERTRFRNAKGKSVKKSRDWILEKKERRRRQGKEVRADTKYTGRKRRPRF